MFSQHDCGKYNRANNQGEQKGKEIRSSSRIDVVQKQPMLSSWISQGLKSSFGVVVSTLN